MMHIYHWSNIIAFLTTAGKVLETSVSK